MDSSYFGPGPEQKTIEGNIKIPSSGIGKSITEGRAGGGTFLDSLKSAIWEGASKVELSTQMEGQEPFTGAESYGKTGREELRKMAEVNQVTLTSVHSPSNIGNLSGFAGGERGFEDTYRELAVNEVRKAIEFAGDVGAPAVVVHTGEYQRPIIEQEWAKDPETGRPMFRHYEEEAERAILPLVDRRTGHLISQVRKNQLVARAIWNRYDPENEQVWKKYGGKPFYDPDNNVWIKPGDYIDYEGHRIDKLEQRVPQYDPENNEFKVRNYTWKDFEEEANIRNQQIAKSLGKSVKELTEEQRVSPEEAFIRATTETQEKIAKGWAGIHSRSLRDEFAALEELKKAKVLYEKIQAGLPKDELWKLRQVAATKAQQGLRYGTSGEASRYIKSTESKLPSEIIDDALRNVRESIERSREAVIGQEQQVQEARNVRDNALPVFKYAKLKTTHSYATLGIHAMRVTEEKHAKKPIFVAPEHIWPEMGFGSHPKELIELVTTSRDKMVEYLTQKKIRDPSGAVYTPEEAKKMGKPELAEQNKIIDNPYYNPHMSKAQARKEAEDHIKATFDTQHLGMWWRHWVPRPGETMENSRKRFDQWYMDQVKEMEEKKILGHIHIVDGWGRGHTHLPPGEGVNPITTAVDYLKKKGYDGAIISEAYGEAGGNQRQLTRTWEAFGSNIYHPMVGPISMGGGAGRGAGWTDVWQSYFGKTKTPYYVFGQYSPSEDWTLWTQVPME